MFLFIFSRQERDELELKFSQYQIEYEKDLYDRLREQFEAEFNEKLDQVNRSTNLKLVSAGILKFFKIKKKVNQVAYVRERELVRKLDECETKISELIGLVTAKTCEIEALHEEKHRFVRDYKEMAVRQIDNLMEQLIAKDSVIQVHLQTLSNYLVPLVFLFKYLFNSLSLTKPNPDHMSC